MQLLIDLVLLATCITNLVLLYRWRPKPPVVEVVPEPPKLKPIHHEPVEGPMVNVATSVGQGESISYYAKKVPKGMKLTGAEQEPFIVSHFQNDTPAKNDPEGHEVRPAIKADSYLIHDTQQIIAGEVFRSRHEFAPVGMQVGALKHSSKYVPHRLSGTPNGPKLTPAEERQLADEYELGGVIQGRQPVQEEQLP